MFGSELRFEPQQSTATGFVWWGERPHEPDPVDQRVAGTPAPPNGHDNAYSEWLMIQFAASSSVSKVRSAAAL